MPADTESLGVECGHCGGPVYTETCGPNGGPDPDCIWAVASE